MCSVPCLFPRKGNPEGHSIWHQRAHARGGDRTYYNNFLMAQSHGCWGEASVPHHPGLPWNVLTTKQLAFPRAGGLKEWQRGERPKATWVLISDITNHHFCHIPYFKGKSLSIRIHLLKDVGSNNVDIFSNHHTYRIFPESTAIETSEEGSRLEESSKIGFCFSVFFF